MNPKKVDNRNNFSKKGNNFTFAINSVKERNPFLQYLPKINNINRYIFIL